MSSTTAARAQITRRTTFDLVVVLAALVALLAGLVPGVALVRADADHELLTFQQFEIDGNITGGRDFDHFVGSEGPTDGVGNDDATWFQPSTRESDYPGWTFKEDGNTPKADLARNWIQTQVGDGPNENWVALGVTRDEDNGNAQITAEFNQSNITSYAGAFRTAGDFYIRFNFPGNANGGSTLDPTQAVGAINARYAVWNGSSFGTEQQLNSTTDPAVRAAISSLDAGDPDGLTFIELIIDLEVVLGEDFNDGCTSFGAAGFRTEATGGNENNDNTTLKDVIQPFPIDLNTCAEVDVEKTDEEGEPLEGAEFTLYTDAELSSPVAEVADLTFNPCTTAADGTCSFGLLEPGTYWIDETDVPDGHRKSTELPDSFTVGANEPVSLSYANPRIPYTIAVDPDGSNAVGNDHVFTVTLTDDEGPLVGETVDLAWTGDGDGITDVDGTPSAPGVTSTTCTTDAAGTCDVTVSSANPGSGDLTASWDTPYQNTVGGESDTTAVATDTSATTPFATISDSANKVWTGLRAEIEADGLNLLGDPHTFTVTVHEDDGDGDETNDALAPDVGVTVSWTGPTGSTLDTTTCTTDTNGACDFVVDSDTNVGTGTLSVTELDGLVGDDEQLVVTYTVGAEGTPSADKTWREYRATIDDDSVNPAGQDHEFTVTVQYRDGTGDSWLPAPDGTTVDWDLTGDGTDVLAESTCDDGTTDGTCTIVITSSTPGVGTVTLTSVDGSLLGDFGTVDESYDVSDVATKTWLDFTVDVEPDATNLVGEPHTFTVTVEESSDGEDYGAIDENSVVDFTLSDPTALVSETCSDPGTDADGECTVTVNSDDTGTVTLTVTGITGYGGFDTAQDVTFEQAGTADKTWVDYRAFIAADGVNLVGDDHVFTVTAQVDDGTGWAAVADDTIVTVSTSGAVGSITDNECETDGTTAGTCTVTVDSDDPGTLTVSVETVANLTAVDSDVATVDVSGGENLEAEGQSTSADKTWIAYRADIDLDATNLTGEPHTFTVTAEQNDGSGWTDVPDGTEVSYSVSDPAAEGDGSTCTTGTVAGECVIEVESDDVAAVTVTVTGVEAVDVDDQPTATITDVSAVKRWVEVLVDVEADATNNVGDDHTFTVDLTLFTPQMPGGTVPTGEFTAVVSSSGTGTIDTDTCATGTTDGQCEVTVSSDDPGSLTISVDSVSFSFGSTDFTVDFTDEVTYGEADGQDLTGTKTWRDYRVDIEADGLNLVRDAHTFTVTVEQTDDGDNWDEVPDGTTVSATAGSPGTIDELASTCGDEGTVDGQCTIVVDSSTAGTSTTTVTAISVDDPATPDAVDPVSFDVTDDSADKTWAAFRASTSGDAVNITGDDHDFIVTAQYTVDGTNWLVVPDGSEVTFTSSGVGSVTDDTCDGTTGGDCTVTVDSDESGQRSITVTGVDATITVGELTESFAVTFADGESGVLEGFDAEDHTATKTWAAYALNLTPLEATNLLNGQDDDSERFHTITATLTSDDATNAPIGGQDIDVSISGDTGTISSVESGTVDEGDLTATCTTDTDGTCDIVIFSATPGTATLAASYEAVVGESDPFTVNAVDADKTWTTFRVTVTPEQATNLVGNAHTFTVTVEQSTTDGDWVAVGGVSPDIEVTGTDLDVDATDCEAGTDAAGQCEVVVNSETVQAVTLTATYDASIGQVTAAFSDSGDKDWIDYAVDVDPDEAENLVDTDHVFTVTVTTTFPGEEGPVTAPVVGGIPTLELTGPGSIVDTDCDEGTDEDGQCTVTTTSPVAGPSTLTATFEGTAGEGDDLETRDYVDSGDKLWVDYLLTVDPDAAVNATDDAHTFTATLLVDTGEGFGPAVDETVDVELGGDTGELVSTTCDGTDEAGQCEIVINSSEPGTTSVTASYGAVVGETSRTFSDTGIKQWAEIDLVKTAILVDGEPLVADEFGDKVLTYEGTAVEDIADQTVTYEYVITNTGPVTIENVRLVDDRLGTLLDGSEGVTLAPGESTTVTADETFSAEDAEDIGIVTNVADVIGDATLTSPDSGLTEVAEVTDTDDETVLLELVLSEVLAPSIDLVKTALVEADADGVKVVTYDGTDDDEETITYEYLITNTGETELVDVTLVDDVLGTLLDGSEGVTLAPGESTTVEAVHVLTEADANAGEVVNVAVTTGTSPQGADVTATDDEVVEVMEVLDVPPLVRTGLDSGALGASGVLLLAIGLGALLVDRRRRNGVGWTA